MARHQTEEPVSLPRRIAAFTLSLGLATGVTLLPAAAHATARSTAWPGHPDRSIVTHTVRPGETATGLAVRYHAWTAELIRLNRLGSNGALYQGQVLQIPVVVSAVRRAQGQTVQQPQRPRTHAHKRKHARPVLLHTTTPPTRGWQHDRMSRTQVRNLVTAMARHYGVPPELALAIAWQESGWQQRRVSSAGALGVMQVMPDTGRWMRWYAGRPLRLRDTHDNVQAGILTLRTLRGWTRRDNTAIAAYYQGLGAVRQHGYFRDTAAYVRAVRAHERRIARTGSPL